MANNIKSTNDKNSRYVWGGDSVQYSDRIGWWERRVLPQSDNDLLFVLTPIYSGRPDLVAYDLYGNAKLQTLVLQYNNILDPEVEFVTGKTIRLPLKSRVLLSILNKKSGGIDPQ